MRRSEAAGLVAVALSLPGAWADLHSYLACWLTAWWCCVGLMLGALCNAWIHRLSGGRWGEALRPVALLAARRMPLALAMFLPVALGLPRLYPWAAAPAAEWARDIAQPGFVTAWLQPGFFAIRMLVYAGLWWWLSTPAALATKKRSVVALFGWGLGTSLASVDLLMSLMPGWFSTAFGLVVLSGQALGGAALCTLWLALRRPAALVARAGPHAPPLGRDLGNLLLMWSMTWGYLAYMEFLIIWAENLPHEVMWFVPRVQGAGAALGLLLVAGALVLPVLALLQRRVKDRPARLGVVAAVMLAAQALNCAWLVLPSVHPQGGAVAWSLPLLGAGFALLLFGPLPGRIERHAAVLEASHG